MRPYPSFVQVLVLTLLALLLARLVVYPALVELSPRVALIGAELVLALIVYLAARPEVRVTEDLLLLNATPLAVLGAAVIAALGAALVLAQIDLGLRLVLADLHLPLPLLVQRRLLEIQLVDGSTSGLLALLAIAVVPALCEEIFFRGLVFTSVAANHGPRLAVVGSALLFTLAHTNPWQALPLFLFGLFLGLLVGWTHSLYPAVLAHMTNNLISLLGVNARAHTGIDVLGATHQVPAPVLIAALVLLWLGLRYIRRQSPWMPLVASTGGSLGRAGEQGRNHAAADGAAAHSSAAQ